MQNIWHNLSFEGAVSQLNSDMEKGLADIEVVSRLSKFGKNVLPSEKPLSKIKIFLEQLKSPLVYVLIFAASVTLFLREWADFIVIFGAVFLNTVVGFFQENKATEALKALKKIVKIEADVIRDGHEIKIDSSDLVPGDIIVLSAGNKIPADGRLIKANNLKINEAPLTGEWLTAQKTVESLPLDVPVSDRDNMVYMGCMVEAGKGLAVITATGSHTQIGRIASMVKETTEEKTPLQKKIARLSKTIGLLVGVIATAIFVGGILQGKETVEMFMMAVAVAVAAIPEGLPVALTVILALGMQRILKRKGLVRKLVAAETLGSTSIIATDKTLTLTEGKMEAVETVTWRNKIADTGKIGWRDLFRKNFSQDQLLMMKILTLSSQAFIENPEDAYPLWIVRGEATDRAMLVAGAEIGFKKSDLEKVYSRIDEVPFNSETKVILSLFETNPLFLNEKVLGKLKVSLIRDPIVKGAHRVMFVSGAPEKVIQMSSFIQKEGKIKKMDAKALEEINKELEGMARRGLRVVAAGYKKIKHREIEEKFKLAENAAEMVFTGFIGLKDPLREEAKQAIKTCKRAGLRTIMVTGDHLLTARAIGEELGMRTKRENILEGRELDEMSEKEFQSRVKNIDIYARVEPRHKMKIIEAWQARGEIVAMTGDGVNDAPALKRADIGVALGSGTDVAKEVSDLILLTDSFNIMVAAVEEGRAIIDNVRKVITYLLSDSFTETILISLSIILGWPLPVAAVQILWVNLVEDGLPSLALAFEPKEDDILQRKPEAKKHHIFTGEMKVIIFIIGILTDLLLLGLFWWLYKHGSDLQYIRTMIFAGLGMNSLFYIFSCKSLRKNIWRINPFSNKFLLLAVGFGFLMLFLGVHFSLFQSLLKTVSLGLNDWLIILGLGVANIILIETAKFYFISRHQLD